MPIPVAMEKGLQSAAALAPRQRISGIRLSGELVLYHHRAGIKTADRFGELLRLIASNRLNLPYVSIQRNSASLVSSFCVERADLSRLERLLASYDSSLDSVHGVGMVSLFPHGGCIEILGKVFSLFGRCDFPMYSCCTSISALTIITDVHRLDAVADALLTIFSLPTNHSPFRSALRISQVAP